MKIIFLDVDGVLNGYSKFTGFLYGWFIKLRLMKYVNKYYDLFGVRTTMTRRLAKIVRKTDAKIVISSSWRGSWYDSYEDKGRRARALEDQLRRFKIYDSVIGITPRSSKGYRETEIRQWLFERDDVDAFVVLDDETSDLQGFLGKELIKTSEIEEGEIIRGAWYENTGLKRKHVKQAIKILNKGMN